MVGWTRRVFTGANRTPRPAHYPTLPDLWEAAPSRMSMPELQALFGFFSVHHSYRAQHLLKAFGVSVAVAAGEGAAEAASAEVAAAAAHAEPGHVEGAAGAPHSGDL